MDKVGSARPPLDRIHPAILEEGYLWRASPSRIACSGFPLGFGLVHLAAKRVQQIYRGAPVLVKGDNKEIVMALREIAAGKIIAAKPLPALIETPEADLLPETGPGKAQ